MKAARRVLQQAASLARYMPWRQRATSAAAAAQLSAKQVGGQHSVRLFDGQFARRMPGLLRVFDDAELNGTSRARWTAEDGRLVFSGRVGGENAEHMEQLPFCGLRVQWPFGLDLSGFHLLRVTARCNLPMKVALEPAVVIAENQVDATLDCAAGGTFESPLRLLKEESRFAFAPEEMLVFRAMYLSLSSAESVSFRLELESVDVVIDEDGEPYAELQRVNRFYPVGYWKDVHRRKEMIDNPGKRRGKEFSGRF